MSHRDGFDAEKSLFINLFDAMPFDVYVADVNDYTLVYTNSPLKDRLASSAEGPCHKVLFQNDSPCMHCHMSQLLDENGKPSGQARIAEVFNDTNDTWYQVQEKCLNWPDGRVVKYSIAVDISQLKETQNRLAEAHAELALKSKQLELQSQTDALTGLNNRLKLDDVLATEMDRFTRYKSEFSVILMDIDNFKSINDKYGHLIGDQALKSVAQILTSNVRKTDIVGRWGGEEFIIICPEIALNEAYSLAEKIRIALAQSSIDGVGVITGSFGVTEAKDGDVIDDILLRADDAMYRAKRHGKNSVSRVQ